MSMTFFMWAVLVILVVILIRVFHVPSHPVTYEQYLSLFNKMTDLNNGLHRKIQDLEREFKDAIEKNKEQRDKQYLKLIRGVNMAAFNSHMTYGAIPNMYAAIKRIDYDVSRYVIHEAIKEEEEQGFTVLSTLGEEESLRYYKYCLRDNLYKYGNCISEGFYTGDEFKKLAANFELNIDDFDDKPFNYGVK